MESTVTPTYFSALHDEAFSLLVESRDYIANLRAQKAIIAQKKSDDLDLTLETMRLTTRLTQVMAWILAQKAVHNQELTPEQGASQNYRLSGQAVCLDHASGDADHLPGQLRDLLHRSYELYRRVSRLDDQIGNRTADEREPASVSAGEGTFPRPVTTSDQNPQTVY